MCSALLLLFCCREWDGVDSVDCQRLQSLNGMETSCKLAGLRKDVGWFACSDDVALPAGTLIAIDM